jgi:hypothetical protein
MTMRQLESFKKELGQLLKKHNVSIIAKSNNNDNDMSVEIGFQFGIHNKWFGRHHLTAYDIDDTTETNTVTG